MVADAGGTIPSCRTFQTIDTRSTKLVRVSQTGIKKNRKSSKSKSGGKKNESHQKSFFGLGGGNKTSAGAGDASTITSSRSKRSASAASSSSGNKSRGSSKSPSKDRALSPETSVKLEPIEEVEEESPRPPPARPMSRPRSILRRPGSSFRKKKEVREQPEEELLYPGDPTSPSIEANPSNANISVGMCSAPDVIPTHVDVSTDPNCWYRKPATRASSPGPESPTSVGAKVAFSTEPIKAKDDKKKRKKSKKKSASKHKEKPPIYPTPPLAANMSVRAPSLTPAPKYEHSYEESSIKSTENSFAASDATPKAGNESYYPTTGSLDADSIVSDATPDMTDTMPVISVPSTAMSGTSEEEEEEPVQSPFLPIQAKKGSKNGRHTTSKKRGGLPPLYRTIESINSSHRYTRDEIEKMDTPSKPESGKTHKRSISLPKYVERFQRSSSKTSFDATAASVAPSAPKAAYEPPIEDTKQEKGTPEVADITIKESLDLDELTILSMKQCVMKRSDPLAAPEPIRHQEEEEEKEEENDASTKTETSAQYSNSRSHKQEELEEDDDEPLGGGCDIIGSALRKFTGLCSCTCASEGEAFQLVPAYSAKKMDRNRNEQEHGEMEMLKADSVVYDSTLADSPNKEANTAETKEDDRSFDDALTPPPSFQNEDDKSDDWEQETIVMKGTGTSSTKSSSTIHTDENQSECASLSSGGSWEDRPITSICSGQSFDDSHAHHNTKDCTSMSLVRRTKDLPEEERSRHSSEKSHEAKGKGSEQKEATVIETPALSATGIDAIDISVVKKQCKAVIKRGQRGLASMGEGTFSSSSNSMSSDDDESSGENPPNCSHRVREEEKK